MTNEDIDKATDEPNLDDGPATVVAPAAAREREYNLARGETLDEIGRQANMPGYQPSDNMSVPRRTLPRDATAETEPTAETRDAMREAA